MDRHQWRATIELARMLLLTSFTTCMGGPLAASFYYGRGERPAHALAAIVMLASVVLSFFVLERIQDRALGFHEPVPPRATRVYVRLWTGSVTWMCTVAALGFVVTGALIRLFLS